MPSVDRIVVGSWHPGDNNKMKQTKKCQSLVTSVTSKAKKNKIMKQKYLSRFFREGLFAILCFTKLSEINNPPVSFVLLSGNGMKYQTLVMRVPIALV